MRACPAASYLKNLERPNQSVMTLSTHLFFNMQLPRLGDRNFSPERLHVRTLTGKIITERRERSMLRMCHVGGLAPKLYVDLVTHWMGMGTGNPDWLIC